VLFTATVISPSLSASPFSTSSLLGDVSATHRSCSGLVNTPMFFWVGARVVVVVVVDMLAVLCALGRGKLQCESHNNEEMSDTGEKNAGKKMEERNSRRKV